MAITADLNGKNYILGKGQVLFDQFASGAAVTATTRGVGERYLGNTSAFSVNQASDVLDHFDSDAGVKVLDSSVQLSVNRTGKMVCDNLNAANVALFFQGAASTVTQVGATGVT